MMSSDDVHMVLAVLFGLGNATSMFLAVRGVPWAWLVVIVSQTLNITYLAWTEQYLVLYGGQPICLLIGIWGLQRWLRKGVHRDPRGSNTAGREPLTELTVRRAAQAAYQRWMAQAGLPAKIWRVFAKDRPREALMWVEAARAALAVVHETPPTSDPVNPASNGRVPHGAGIS